MGWFFNKIEKKMLSTMREEMENFRDSLKGMSDQEIGHLLALVNHLRIKYESIGHKPLEPLTYPDQNSEFQHQLFAAVKKSQQNGQAGLQVAAATMVWLHTTRAGKYPELRYIGQAIWQELQRGFPLVEQAAASNLYATGMMLVTFEATRFPVGMEPRQ